MATFKQPTIDKIRKFLSSIQFTTIDEVKTAIGANWRTAKRYLQHLKKNGIIGSKMVGGKIVYSIDVTIHRLTVLSEQSDLNEPLMSLEDSLETAKAKIIAIFDDLIRKIRVLLGKKEK